MTEISRYRVSAGDAGEYQPGSRGRVLRNLRGVTRKREMDQLEAESLSKSQNASFDAITTRSRFTAKLIRGLHRSWLGHLYDWAGEYRNVELAKGGFRWPPAKLVEQNMKSFERSTLARLTPCRSGPLEVVCLKLAEVHGEFLLIHPFRDGNGRLARWITNLMALQAGLPNPDYGFTGRGAKQRRADYLSGVIQAYAANVQPLADFFVTAFVRTLRRVDAAGLGKP